MSLTVVIATIPPRKELLQRAVDSVLDQTVKPDRIIVETDPDHTGAAATKNRGLAKVTTEWVTFLDDDDWLLTDHLEILLAGQAESGADVVYTWPFMDGAPDPRPDRFGKPFDPVELRKGSYLHTVLLVRAEPARQVGGFQKPAGSDYDDWGFHLALLDAGAVFHHVSERTWVWTVKGQNTSGRGDRW